MFNRFILGSTFEDDGARSGVVSSSTLERIMPPGSAYALSSYVQYQSGVGEGQRPSAPVSSMIRPYETRVERVETPFTETLRRVQDMTLGVQRNLSTIDEEEEEGVALRAMPTEPLRTTAQPVATGGHAPSFFQTITIIDFECVKSESAPGCVDLQLLKLCCSAFPNSKFHLVSEYEEIDGRGLDASITIWSEYTLSHVFEVVRRAFGSDAVMSVIVKNGSSYPELSNVVCFLQKSESGEPRLSRL
jgi:hypothetical protein